MHAHMRVHVDAIAPPALGWRAAVAPPLAPSADVLRAAVLCAGQPLVRSHADKAHACAHTNEHRRAQALPLLAMACPSLRPLLASAPGLERSLSHICASTGVNPPTCICAGTGCGSAGRMAARVLALVGGRRGGRAISVRPSSPAEGGGVAACRAMPASSAAVRPRAGASVLQMWQGRAHVGGTRLPALALRPKSMRTRGCGPAAGGAGTGAGARPLLRLLARADRSGSR